MKKLIIITLFAIFYIMLWSNNNYILERYTINSAGNTQQTDRYSCTSSFSEIVIGKIRNSQRVGYLGYIYPKLDVRLPKIVSIIDLPHDQGHKVSVIWNKCGFDDDYSQDNFYSLWRKDNFSKRDRYIQLKNKARNVRKESFVTQEYISKEEDKSNIFQDPLIVIQKAKEEPNRIFYWQKNRELWTFIAQIPALEYSQYSYVAETLQDSTNGNPNYSTFKVIFHDIFHYYESLPDSGYSTDDIAPDRTIVSIVKTGNELKLFWDKVEYGTYQGNRYQELNGIWYKIYASDTPFFNCDSTTFIDKVSNLEYEINPTLNKRFFKVIVSDK